MNFEWDEQKDQENVDKHGVSFFLAQLAFADPMRVVAEDLENIALMKIAITASDELAIAS